MAYIAHSSIDERGRIKGGQAGDQTGREVCIRTAYDVDAGFMLRINNQEVREQFGDNMIDICRNKNVGYDQGGRMTLLKEAIKVNFDFSKINVPCEGDCSSTIIAALLGAIYKVLGKEAYEAAYKILVVKGNAAVTGNMRARMKKLSAQGILKVTVYSSKRYTRSYAKAIYGDIYLREYGHVICFVDNAVKRIVNKAPEYAVGKTYTIQTELKVRKGPGTENTAKKHSGLTTDGKKHDTDKDGALEKGTKVTCLEIKEDGKDVWIRIPSGWVAAFYQGNVYVK